MINFKLFVPALCAGAMTIAPTTVSAADPGASDDWQFKAGMYLWGAGIKVGTAAGSDVDISFDDLISNLNMAFMGDFEARKSKWSLAADLIYLNVGAGDGGSVPISTVPGVSLEVDADIKLRAWVMGFTGGYNLWQSERGTLDAIAGARYLEVKVTLDATKQLGPLARQRETTASGENWDAIIGVKGDINLADKWYAPYYLDVGTGDSDLTWQIAAGVGYRFNWGEVNLLYRHMDWDFKSGSAVDNLNLSGPQLGARFNF